MPSALFASALVLGLGLLSPAAVALADPTPTCSPDQSRLCTPTTTPGGSTDVATADETVTFSTGDGQLDPGTDADVDAQSVTVFLGRVKVNAAGAASLTFKVPAVLPAGTHHVIFVGVKNGSPRTISFPLTVVPRAVVGGGTGVGNPKLPLTGTSTLLPLAEAGLGLVVVGSGALILIRRRRPLTATAA